jgi:hypothetical protein
MSYHHPIKSIVGRAMLNLAGMLRAYCPCSASKPATASAAPRWNAYWPAGQAKSSAGSIRFSADTTGAAPSLLSMSSSRVSRGADPASGCGSQPTATSLDGTMVTGNGTTARYSSLPTTWVVCSYAPERSSKTVSSGRSLSGSTIQYAGMPKLP